MPQALLTESQTDPLGLNLNIEGKFFSHALHNGHAMLYSRAQTYSNLLQAANETL